MELVNNTPSTVPPVIMRLLRYNFGNGSTSSGWVVISAEVMSDASIIHRNGTTITIAPKITTAYLANESDVLTTIFSSRRSIAAIDLKPPFDLARPVIE